MEFRNFLQIRYIFVIIKTKALLPSGRGDHLLSNILALSYLMKIAPQTRREH
jgi:hypothetical protein